MGSHLSGAMAWLLDHGRVAKGREGTNEREKGGEGVGVAAQHTPETLNAKDSAASDNHSPLTAISSFLFFSRGELFSLYLGVRVRGAGDGANSGLNTWEALHHLPCLLSLGVKRQTVSPSRRLSRLGAELDPTRRLGPRRQ